MKDKVLVVIGPSCAGKDTLADRAIGTASQGAMTRVVRTTTRPPRRGERGEKRYEFVSKDTFNALKASGSMLEDSSYRGWQYGTRVGALSPDTINVLTLDLKSLKRLWSNAKNVDIRVVFVDAPLGTRLKRYYSRDGHKSFEMYRRALSDSLQYRHAVGDLLRMGIPYTYLPAEFGLYKRTNQVMVFCRDWLRGSDF
mgnify:CR=1 FL=1